MTPPRIVLATCPSAMSDITSLAIILILGLGSIFGLIAHQL